MATSIYIQIKINNYKRVSLKIYMYFLKLNMIKRDLKQFKDCEWTFS